MISLTWWVTRKTEEETRVLKRARIVAGRKGDPVLDDVEVEEEEEERLRGGKVVAYGV